jgi:hypothetical protein
MCSSAGSRNKVWAVVAACVCALGTLRAEINLTPVRSVRELEGCKFPQLEFRDGEKRITYEAPRGWEAFARDSSTVALVPAGKAMVSAKIKYIPAPGHLTLDEAQLKYLQDTASQLLPEESRLMADPVITPKPLLFNDYATCEVELQFVLHAQRLRMCVLFVDLGETQLRFSLISRAGDYEELHKAFRDSWFSWQWVEPVQGAVGKP